MITATLHPPTAPLEISLDIYRSTRALARRERATSLADARKRARRYAKGARERGYRDGQAQGLAESTRAFSESLGALRHHYQEAVDAAREDVTTIAYQIVEHLITSYLEHNPDQLREWITHALENLKHTRGLTLHYHPRYHELLTPFIEESKDIMRSVRDPSLGDRDFSIATDAGEITFAWREMLSRLTHVATPDGR